MMVALILSRSYWFEYHLTEFSSYAKNKDDSAGNPLLYKGYGGVGNEAIKVRQGMMIQNGQILSNILNSPSTNNYLTFDPPTTFWFSVFIFDVNQKSTLFGNQKTMSELF